MPESHLPTFDDVQGLAKRLQRRGVTGQAIDVTDKTHAAGLHIDSPFVLLSLEVEPPTILRELSGGDSRLSISERGLLRIATFGSTATTPTVVVGEEALPQYAEFENLAAALEQK